MPSLNRPNAPKRLPSAVIEGVFFRPGRAKGSLVLPPGSPETFSAASPSPVSPTTVVTPRGTTKQARRGLLSESHAKSALRQESISTTTALESIAPAIAQEAPSSTLRSASLGSTDSAPSSSRSSFSAKAKKLFNVPSLRRSGTASKDDAPPRQPRRGYEWKHEVSGHWLEIRIGRKRQSESRLPSQAETLTPHTKRQASTDDNHHRLNATEVTVTTPLSHTASKIKFSDSKHPLSSPSETLYHRTKRRLGLKRGITTDLTTDPFPRTKTGEVLDRTSSMLRLVAMRQPSLPSASTSSSALSNLSIAAPKWQRRLGGRRSVGSGHVKHGSSSSSIRSLLMGKPPVPTPEPQDMYTAPDGKQYCTVELTEPNAPKFLPSEAKRIKTPPIGKNKMRGFFFDYNAASSAAASEAGTPFEERLPPFSVASNDERMMLMGRQRRISETEWYRVKLDTIESEERDGELEREKKEMMQVPDHLPSSPLCPVHPKHKSGGWGTCPQHGKREIRWMNGRGPLLSPMSLGGDNMPHQIVY